MEGTLVAAFLQTVARLGQGPALRWRSSSGWDTLSWNDYAARTEAVAAGLWQLGLRPGDRLAILADNCPQWVIADLGAMRLGVVTVPIYPTLVAAQTQHILEHGQVRAVVVQNAAQRAKVQEAQPSCPSLQHIIVIDPRDAGECLSWDAFVGQGQAALQAHAEAVRAAQAALQPTGLATIVYTSGTTGPPKGAMLSHRNLRFEAEQVLEMAKLHGVNSSLSFLPLSHVAERLQGEIMAVVAGYTVHFGRGIDSVRDDLLEVRPDILVCVPRLWEKMHEAIVAQVARAPLRRRLIFGWAQRMGLRRWRKQMQGRKGLSLRAAAADRLIGKALRARLGLDRARFLVSGAAPLNPTIQDFFGALGLPILEAYGQTECTGISHGCVESSQIRRGYVGIQIPGIEVRVAADGEICVRGDNVFMGYYNDPSATAAALVDGWLHTGDVGEIDNGYLRLTDRKKDIIVTAGGKNVAPQNIENRLRAQPGISQAVVLGDRRKYLVALVTLDPDRLAVALGRRPQAPLSRDPAARRWVQEAIDRVNGELSSFETIKRFEVLDDEFSIERGELTPTLKVKRRVIDERYRHVIEGLYQAA